MKSVILVGEKQGIQMQEVTISSDEKKNLWYVITASSVGTLIEWYDFYIFGSLAIILSEQFFPDTNPTAAFLATLGTFGAGFVVRPFGAIVFGRLGDIVGRKYTFLVTLLLMGGSTFAIGLVPGYGKIGILAPVIVLLLRLLQGLALGGEYGGAATYVAEHAPAARRGFYTSFIQTTATLGLIVSLGVILIVRNNFTPAEFNEWGWRIPFLLSAVLVMISFFIRMRMNESPLFAKIKAEGKVSKNPIKESFGNKANLRLVLIALFGATAGQGVVWYTGQFYAMTFIEKICQIESVQTLHIIAIGLVLATPFFIYFGSLSDRIGRKMIMMIGMLLAIICYRPIYSKMYSLSDISQKTEITGQRTIESVTSTADDGTLIETKKAIHFYEDGTRLTETSIGDKVKSEISLSGSPFYWMIALVFIQVVFVTMVYGPIAAFLVELFPTRIRYTSMSLPYHIGNGIFGGLTPLLAVSLFELSKTESNPEGDLLAGLWYPIVVGGICFVVGMIFLSNKKKGEVLEED